VADGGQVPRRGHVREHRPIPELITSLAGKVVDGQIQLPRFQRDFVWSRQQVLDLLDSIARSYPIGSFLLWKSDDSASLASDQTIAGLRVEDADDGEEAAYLLDGCQRLSTICGALYWQPNGDPGSFWNLAYDLELERFLHRRDLDDPPANQIPLRLLAEPSDFFNRIKDLPDLLHERAAALFNRFERYEVAVVTLHATPFSEIGRIFERVNTRGTPLTTVELVQAATWTADFDLLVEIDAVRAVLAGKHYGQIERMLLLRAIAAAAGLGFSKENVESLALADHSVLRTAVTETAAAARLAVDFLTTEIGTPTADALPYLNQLAVVIEIFRRVPRPSAPQFKEIRSWFWSTALTGYFEGWNARKMAADLTAVKRFTDGAKTLEVVLPAPSIGLWTGQQYRRDTARTKALALMLAAAGPRDLRSGQRIDVGRALALANELQFHHFFPKNWLMTQGTPYEDANVLANIAMLTAISNQMIADQPPAAYLEYELGFCDEQELMARLDSLLISPQAYEAAKSNNYERFISIRADDLLRWAGDLMRGERPVRPLRTDSPEVMRHGMTVEVEDKDTED
jgi:hypothetical protein